MRASATRTRFRSWEPSLVDEVLADKLPSGAANLVKTTAGEVINVGGTNTDDASDFWASLPRWQSKASGGMWEISTGLPARINPLPGGSPG